MALIFQSNPDKWDIRFHLIPGKTVQWFVSRYKSLMQSGRLVLFWSAQGSQPPNVRGIYGWGISTGEMVKDKEGNLRLPVRYIERWVHPNDVQQKTSPENQIAPISANSIRQLHSWSDHLLVINPIGGNFVINREQMLEFLVLVKNIFPKSQLIKASQIDGTIDPNRFKPMMLGEVQNDK